MSVWNKKTNQGQSGISSVSCKWNLIKQPAALCSWKHWRERTPRRWSGRGESMGLLAANLRVLGVRKTFPPGQSSQHLGAGAAGGWKSRSHTTGLQSNPKSILQAAFMACNPHWHRQVLVETATSLADCEDIRGEQEPIYPQADTGGKEGANSRDQFLSKTTSQWPHGPETLQLKRSLKNPWCLVRWFISLKRSTACFSIRAVQHTRITPEKQVIPAEDLTRNTETPIGSVLFGPPGRESETRN